LRILFPLDPLEFAGVLDICAIEHVSKAATAKGTWPEALSGDYFTARLNWPGRFYLCRSIIVRIDCLFLLHF